MKNYFKKLVLLFAVALVLIVSCSKDEEDKSDAAKSGVAARPTLPITNSEVRIGTQIWMTKNVNVSRYRNGDPIPQVTDATQWANLTTGAWCYYNNDSANGVVYGKLYNWYAAMDPRGLAPQGWHVPTNGERIILTTFLGGEIMAGGKMKAITTWTAPNTGATNSSGFSGLPGGVRFSFSGDFGGFDTNGVWWTTSLNGTYVYSFGLFNENDDANIGWADKNSGFSVRCLRN